jgi:hypothetical protein
MTRSSRKISERFGRSKSYKSPHSRNFRRRKDNDRKRSARCQQRSDLAANIESRKSNKIKKNGTGAAHNCAYISHDNHHIHSLNGTNHMNSRSGIQYFNETGQYNEVIGFYGGNCWEPELQININSFKKMKKMWDKCTHEQRMSVFEALGNKTLERARGICNSNCTLEEFGQFVYDVCECHDHLDKWFIDIDVAIKRVYRRGSSKKFVSHRNHKEKYAY